MKRVLVPMALALALAGCTLPGGGRPDVPAAAESPIAAPPSTVAASVSPDQAACDAARALDTAGATTADYAVLGRTVARADDGLLADAGVALQRAAADGIGARTSVYAAYLGVMAQCQRWPALSPSASPS